MKYENCKKCPKKACNYLTNKIIEAKDKYIPNMVNTSILTMSPPCTNKNTFRPEYNKFFIYLYGEEDLTITETYEEALTYILSQSSFEETLQLTRLGLLTRPS